MRHDPQSIRRRARVLDVLLRRLLSAAPWRFEERSHKPPPSRGGVYAVGNIENGTDRIIYVGRTTQLRKRICGDHLTGDDAGSTLRRKLVARGLCVDSSSVRPFLERQCAIRFIELPRRRTQVALEHYAAAVLLTRLND